MPEIDNRVLEIAERAWGMISERHRCDGDTPFEMFVYEQTTEWLIDLDKSFQSHQARQDADRLFWDGERQPAEPIQEEDR